MEEAMEVSKEKCHCFNAACTTCSGFQKILYLKDAGLIVYRYTKCIDKVNKTTGRMESSINTTDDVFIIHNTKDIQIKANEFATEIDEVSCPRCRELVQRAHKYLENIPNIDKKGVISVCDHCKNKKQSNKYSCKCHEALKTFLAEKERESKGKEKIKGQIKKWLSKINKLLSKTIVDDKIIRLKYRARSELHINKLYEEHVSSSRRLEIGPILEVGVKITGPRLIGKVATKSESALKRVDYKKIKFKPSSMESNSFIEIERHVSSSLETYDTSLDKDTGYIDKRDLETDSFEHLKRKRLREFAPKTAIEHHRSPATLKKYYSDETMFLYADGFKNVENVKRNFSFVFPKEESKEKIPLRRVKTSAELIEDTQDKLRLRLKLINDEINRRLEKKSKITSSNKQKQVSAEKNGKHDIKIKISQEGVKTYDENLQKPQSEEAKTEHMEIKTDEDEIQKDKKEEPSSMKATTEDKKTKSNKYDIQKDINEKLLSKKEKIEDKGIKSDKYKIQKDKTEGPSSKKATTEDKKIKHDKDSIQKDETERTPSKKDKADDKEMKSDQYNLQKDKTDRPSSIKITPKDKKTKSDKDNTQKDKTESPSSKKQKTYDKEIKSDNDKTQKDKKVLQQLTETLKDKTVRKKEEKAKDIDEKQSNKKEQQEKENKHLENKTGLQKEKENKKEQEKQDKEKKKVMQEEKEKKEKGNKNQQLLKDEEKKSMEEKINNQDEKPHIGDDKAAADNFRKMIEEQTKLKAEALNIKKQQEEENRKLRMEAEKKTKEAEPKPKLKGLQEPKDVMKLEKEEPKHEIKQEEPTIKELNIKQIKIRKPSTDDLILRLVRLKQASKKVERPKRLSEINITPLIVNEHKGHKARKVLNCAICVDSSVELDLENIINDISKSDEVTDLIVGNKIIKSKHPLSNDMPVKEEMLPVLFKSLFTEDMAPKPQKEIAEKGTDTDDLMPPTLLSQKYAEPEPAKGITRYALSDRSFIDKGWTMLPTEKVVRKMNVYRMRPAHPEFDWFERNKNKRLMLHDTGEKFAEFDDNGRGRWFYRNGKLALDYYDAEELNAQQRFVIYGSGEPDERGRYQPISILATFDYLGNGVVLDHTGKIRLKYNQTEGVVLDRNIGPVSHWKWHTLNDPPVLQQVMIDTQMAHKDPEIVKLGGPADEKVRPDNEEMLAIEFDNFIKEKSKKLTQKFKPFQIRSKALKINENFSLKILDQANIYLIFRDGTTNIKINIGMILDHQEIVDTDTAEVGEVSNDLERFPARTDSLAGLQRSVAYAQRVERLRVERERRLKHPEKTLSVDQLGAAASRPLRSQVKLAPSDSTGTKDKCLCKCRKPSSSNIYYDTRLV